MAGNRWLRERIPRLPFARKAVLRFMPGEDLDSALHAAARFREQGISAALTRLGENITRIEESDEVAAHYLGVMDRIASDGLDAEVSVKLTQLGLDLDEERTFSHVRRLAERSGVAGHTLWIDMEGSAYTEGTVAMYERLKRTDPNVGVCLQAYLRRTADDLRRLLPLSPAIRLVKGAYAEPAAIAYQSRADVDRSFSDLARAMLEAKRDGMPIRIALGTHDVRLIEEAAGHAASIGLPKTAIEVQMLYGIRADQQRRIAGEGFPVRDLICYGAAWYPWYMRRLAERPANVLFALRQLQLLP
jgi:proline dehydrogenase